MSYGLCCARWIRIGDALTMIMRMEKPENDRNRGCAEAQSFSLEFSGFSPRIAKTYTTVFDTHPSLCPAVISHAKASPGPNHNPISHVYEGVSGRPVLTGSPLKFLHHNVLTGVDRSWGKSMTRMHKRGTFLSTQIAVDFLA